MAFQSKNLSVLAYANGFTLWHYATVDGAADVLAASYFDGAADMMRTGDVILLNTDTETAPNGGFVRVASSAGGEVAIGPMGRIAMGASGLAGVSHGAAGQNEAVGTSAA